MGVADGFEIGALRERGVEVQCPGHQVERQAGQARVGYEHQVRPMLIKCTVTVIP